MTRPRPPFVAAGFFVLRTPLLPFHVVDALKGDPDASLDALLEDPVVREAIFVASPALDQAIERHPQRGPYKRRLRESVLRYVSRMASRPTPFGLMSAVSVGHVGPETKLPLCDRHRYDRHTRLDHGYLASLVASANAAAPAARRRCRPNETLYSFCGELRYVETVIEEGVRAHRIAAIEATEHLLKTLERARDGDTVEALARALTVDDPEIEREDAIEYVQALIQQQVLIDSLQANITGDAAVGSLEAAFRARGDEQPSADLARVAATLQRWDSQRKVVSAADYRALADSLPEGHAALDRGALVQVDITASSLELQLGVDTVAAFAEAAIALHSLFARADDPDLVEFRARFRERFDRREVPLLHALDADAGIGFGVTATDAASLSPLLDGLGIARRRGEVPSGGRPAGELVMRRLFETLQRGGKELELRREDLERLPPPVSPLPVTFSVVGAVGMDAGRTVVRADHVLGASGARLLGRFCHGLPELGDAMRTYLAAEADPDHVIAEIVHLPEGRIGNVVARPLLHQYELPLLGESGAPANRRLDLADLCVSVVGEEIVLRSRRLDRRVVPRLTTAHNYDGPSNLPLYRFLCKLQGQGITEACRWSWDRFGSRFECSPFLPRVRYGHAVLAPAQWTIEPAAIRRSALPRFVLYGTLLVDLENDLSVDTMLRDAKGAATITLRELFPVPDALAVTGTGGRFVHEVIVPFIGSRRPATRPRIPMPSSKPRTFPPGSLWTYAKLYGPRSRADRVLTTLVRPLVERLTGDGTIEAWFFARYADPEPHLRLRLRAAVETKGGAVLAAMSEVSSVALQGGLLHRIQFDTYEREIERYGGPDAIELAEAIFHRDSEAVLALLECRGQDRWRIAFAGLRALLEALIPPMDVRHRVVRECREAFGAEFGVDAAFRRRLAGRVREIDPLTVRDERPDHVSAILGKRTSALAPIVTALAKLKERGRLTVPMERFTISHLHMFVNRMLEREQRAHELVFYDLLDRLYRSDAARIALTRPAPFA